MIWGKNIFLIYLATISLWLCGCTFPNRTGYDRNIGTYKTLPQKQTQKEEKTTSEANSKTNPIQSTTPTKISSVGKIKQKATAKIRDDDTSKKKSYSSLEQLAKNWIGTPYVYGGSSKSGIDCSGYVMQIYKSYYGLSMPHNASQMYNDSRGSSVSRGSLKEGDLVFFGSFWKIDHVGIYLSGDRFTHASSSRGVMISPMEDKYWKPKYQGARRFK